MNGIKNFDIPEGFYLKGYKIQIFPTETQKEFINECIDVNRFIYNWSLEQENNQYEMYKNGETDKKFLSLYDLNIKFTEFRSYNEWLQKLPYTSARNAINRCIIAFSKFFNKINKYPKYKSKKRSQKESFSTRNDRMYFDDNLLRIEGLPRGEKIYTKFHTGKSIKDNIKYFNTVITRDNHGNYFISFKVLEEKKLNYFIDNNIQKTDRAIGIDLNVKDRFVLSTGEVFRAPNTEKLEKRLKRLHGKCKADNYRRIKLERANPDKDITISNRSKKRITELRKTYSKIYNINTNFIETTTKKIINKNPKAIVMENLKVKSIEKKKHVSKLTHRTCFYQCIATMERKCNIYNIPFIKAARTYPSSQLCSRCGNKQKIGSNKVYSCPVCGLIINRDLNASLNLEKLAYI